MNPAFEAAVIAFYKTFYGPLADLDGGWETESEPRQNHFRNCLAQSLSSLRPFAADHSEQAAHWLERITDTGVAVTRSNT